jgi:hypothetical protein
MRSISHRADAARPSQLPWPHCAKLIPSCANKNASISPISLVAMAHAFRSHQHYAGRFRSSQRLRRDQVCFSWTVPATQRTLEPSE